jgi:hypothetical protein
VAAVMEMTKLVLADRGQYLLLGDHW